MKATSESSAPYQTALDWSVPSQWQPQLRADLNELQAYRTAQQDPAKVAAKKARALHAGSTKSSRLHDAINAMVEQRRPQLEKWTGSDTSRACWLTKLIHPDAKLDRSGRPSGWRTVYNHLKTLSF
ncbi:hypothetical protein [Pseudomonas izuensis]|uniref:hypothetical protein n=1 Tax=Pseudomonas izuensis TaxID=2684212 RepID=UPI001358E2A1|nr:hypothetical protein [Pseudomonas izuensis]